MMPGSEKWGKQNTENLWDLRENDRRSTIQFKGHPMIPGCSNG